MNIRKYRIAALLAEYTHDEQERIIKELCGLLNISSQMFRLYVNVRYDSKRNNLNHAKLETIAKYFNVSIGEIYNSPRKIVLTA